MTLTIPDHVIAAFMSASRTAAEHDKPAERGPYKQTPLARVQALSERAEVLAHIGAIIEEQAGM